MDWTYTIIPITDLDQIKINDCGQDSFSTVRVSVDQTMVILKYCLGVPEWGYMYTRYTHEQILEILNSPIWGVVEE